MIYVITGFLGSGKTNFIKALNTDLKKYKLCDYHTDEPFEIITILEELDLSKDAIVEMDGLTLASAVTEYLYRNHIAYSVTTVIDLRTFYSYFGEYSIQIADFIKNSDFIYLNAYDLSDSEIADRKRTIEMVGGDKNFLNNAALHSSDTHPKEFMKHRPDDSNILKDDFFKIYSSEVTKKYSDYKDQLQKEASDALRIKAVLKKDDDLVKISYDGIDLQEFKPDTDVCFITYIVDSIC